VRSVDKQSSHALGRSVRAITGSASSDIDIAACGCGDDAGSALVRLQERNQNKLDFSKAGSRHDFSLKLTGCDLVLCHRLS
jgi:hypothetical protein